VNTRWVTKTKTGINLLKGCRAFALVA